MKNKIYIQLIIALGGAWLLYNAQDWGLNALILSLLASLALIATQPTKWLRALVLVFAGVLAAAYGNTFSICMYLVALALAATSTKYTFKTPLAIIHGAGQLLTNGWHYAFKPQAKTGTAIKWLNGRSAVLMIVPLIVTLVFYSLYASASPEFSDKISQIQGPNWAYVGWSALFFYLSFGLVYSLGGEKLNRWQTSQVDTLQRIRKKIAFDLNPFFLKWEYQTALILLVMLNALLLVFNFIDLEMVLNNAPGKGIHLQKLVHQGVGTIIISILLAVSLLLYIFRGNLNFFKKNNTLKQLTYLWLLQNGWLAFTTLQKNWWYVAQYGLTYKRIGVWIYLILVLAGLTLTWLKVKEKRSLWWLLRRNIQLAVTVLFLMAAAPWSRIITWYDINHARKTDFNYLLGLPLDNTDQLTAAEHSMSWKEATQLHARQKLLHRQVKLQNWKGWTITNLYSYAQLEKLD